MILIKVVGNQLHMTDGVNSLACPVDFAKKVIQEDVNRLQLQHDASAAFVVLFNKTAHRAVGGE